MNDPTASEQLIRVARVHSEPLAEMWAELLRQEGINPLLRSGGPGAGALASGALLEYSIWVLASDADRARQVLESLQSADASADDETEPRSS